ncbi:gluconokinase [Mobilicoccus pelagius NBRC 104925]|uniref:Gluconokinase n=1 Tax=Mobilicoccus pelagius NBRC 104925 TaxID=1089455 RepID=H5UQX6_9MICO|nr:gluconokinase [Mobilicoccus pelagius NBRC 104925]
MEPAPTEGSPAPGGPAAGRRVFGVTVCNEAPHASSGQSTTERPLAVVMGFYGSGGSVCGEARAKELGVPIADADVFHPPANVDETTEPLQDDEVGLTVDFTKSVADVVDEMRGHLVPGHERTPRVPGRAHLPLLHSCPGGVR